VIELLNRRAIGYLQATVLDSWNLILIVQGTKYGVRIFAYRATELTSILSP